MTTDAASPADISAPARPRLVRHGLALVAGSVAGGLALLWLHVSAALLFGPLAAALVLAARSSLDISRVTSRDAG